jgi:fructose-1,6-bisphosphatase I
MSYAVEFRTTLTQHVYHHHHKTDDQRDLSALITQIGVAGKLISAQVKRAGIIEIWGNTGEINVQGEEIQKLDRIANDTMIEVLKQSGCVAAMASEEEEEWIRVPDRLAGKYIVVFDPLDGSSNIDVSMSIGTIFGIYECAQKPDSTQEILIKGEEMIAAGYVMYGSSTVFVFATKDRVDCFTLDPSAGEYFLSRSQLKMPNAINILSVNECNEPYWPDWVKPTLDQIKSKNTPEKRVVTSRHIGSLVADFHRNLIKGGLFLYPIDKHNKKGKLRLLYECNPLAFISRAAGGSDTDGHASVLRLQPKSLHDRVGFYVGSKEAIEIIESAMAESEKNENLK